MLGETIGSEQMFGEVQDGVGAIIGCEALAKDLFPRAFGLAAIGFPGFFLVGL